MSPRARSLAFQIGGVVLALVLLWLALRGLRWAELRAALASAHWGWLGPLALLMLGSHALRAWRWTMLLGGLDHAPGRRPVRTPFAFAAVMIGYMVNYAAPRVGEVVRTTTVARYSGQPFSAVLGTVVLERLLDVVALALGLLTVPFLLGPRLGGLETLLGVSGQTGLLVLLGGLFLLGAGAVVGWLVLGRAARTDGSGWWARRVGPLVAGFRDGLATLRTSPQRAGLVASTVLMWLGYGAIAWLPFRLLGLGGITLVDGWCLMLIGALGMVVPTPGGAGSYHYITVQVLVGLYGMAETSAQVYAVFAHGAQLVLYTLTGALCLLAVARGGRRHRELRADDSPAHTTVRIRP